MENYSHPKNSIDKEKIESSFKSYLEYFSLTEEELQKSILDIGAGSGYFVAYMRDILGNKNTYGVEKQGSKVHTISEGMIVADGLNVPFPNESFQIVLSRNYLPMFADEYENGIKAILEMIRVVKSGGKIMFDIPTPEKELESMKNEELYPDLKTKIWLKKRYGGSIKIFDFLNTLDKSKYSMEIKNVYKNNTVVTINKL